MRVKSNNESVAEDSGPYGLGTEEGRYNLATRIMSNGVEVIVASNKSTLPGGQLNQNLRILASSEHYKFPMTLAPSTLKDHMLLLLRTSTDSSGNGNSKETYFHEPEVNNISAIFTFMKHSRFLCTQRMDELQLVNQSANLFVTKTCLTTFTYFTTYLHEGTATVESREKVISNTATEERNSVRIQATPTSGILLSQVS